VLKRCRRQIQELSSPNHVSLVYYLLIHAPAELHEVLFSFGFALDIMLIEELDQLIGPDPEFSASISAIGHPIARGGKSTGSSTPSAIGCPTDDGARKRIE
jgi:hypothetical protein